MPKCRFCKREIKGVDDCYVDTSGKRKVYYCNEEHYNLEQERLNKPVEISPRKELLDCIQDIYIEHGIRKTEINWTLITAQIKNMMEDNKDMKYTGMKYCLWYMKEIIQVNFFNEQAQTVVSLLPFYYAESKEHWEKQYELKQTMETFKFEESVVVKKSIHREEKKFYKEIDISSLI